MTVLTLRSLRWWLCLTVAACSLLGPAAAWASDRQKQVLALYSTRRDAQISIVGDRELPTILEEGLRQGLDYYSEYIDLARFPDPGYQATILDFLRLKYRGQRFDLVIAIQNTAIEFVDKHRRELFPDAPVVFLGTDPVIRRPENSTGVIAELNLRGTLDLAAKLHPDLRQVFFVSGAGGPDKAYERRARAQFSSFEPRLAATYLSGLTTKELEARLSTLPAHSIVYFLLVYQDGAGANFHPLEYVDRVVAVANRPTYSWVDSTMEHGIVGGSLLSQEAQMEAVGTLALRVLRGEQADDIPTSTPDLHVDQVDWRQLQRWHINEARVPPGTLVRFRAPSVWQRYKVYIVGAMTLLLTQTALIAGLLIQAARRRQAEEQARESQVELRTSYERIRDLGGRLLSAQDAERSRIARELHDDISQQVAVLAIDLELLRGLGEARPNEADRLGRGALDRVESIARSVHDLSHRLHPAKLKLIGLVPALEGLQRELSQPDLAIRFRHDNVPPALPHELTLCLFRIAQEAVGNAVKHSAARKVLVGLRGDQDELALTITDDGKGFDSSTVWGRGLGLISMRERLDAIGGTLKIRSKPGEGTHLEATVPLHAAQSMHIVASRTFPVPIPHSAETDQPVSSSRFGMD